MPILRSNATKYNPVGEAARLQQRRSAELDRANLNQQFPTFFVKGFWFRPYYNSHDIVQIKGPLCPGALTKDKLCLSPLVGNNDLENNAKCLVCDRQYEMPYSFQDFRGVAHRAYEGLLNSQAELITLDVPYEAIKAEAEDETRKALVVWSQKDGRNQAIIYLIEKGRNGAKTHIFADLDREEVRYDADDIPPGEIVAKINAQFKHTKVELEYIKD